MGFIANLAASARSVASSLLARVLPQPKPAAFPQQPALPAYAGPAGEAHGAQRLAMPNVQVINDWIIPSTLGWTLDAAGDELQPTNRQSRWPQPKRAYRARSRVTRSPGDRPSRFQPSDDRRESASGSSSNRTGQNETFG
jgi:hypothetical protein